MKARTLVRTALVVLIPLIILVIFLVNRTRTENPSGSAPVPAGYTHANVYSNWDKFLSSKEWKRAETKARPKVVFIGTDGSTWNIVDSLLAKGALPTYARIRREGVHGVLRSGECYVSPPAWVSMMTGVSPVRHGIHTFGRWDDAEREFISYSSEDVLVPAVWDIASHAGRKVAVTNMAVTYPAQPVNGIMVTGLLTPIMIDDTRPVFHLRFDPYEGSFTQAIGLTSYAPVLRSTFNVFANTIIILLYDSTDDSTENYDRGVVTVIPGQAVQDRDTEVEYHHFKLDRYSPWLKLDFRKERKQREGWCQLRVDLEKLPMCSVRLSAVYCSPDDPDVYYTYPKDFGSVLKKEFKYYFPYTPFDREQIPEFAEDAAKYATFFYEYDDWDLFMYVFYGPDKSQHVTGFSESTVRVHQTIDAFLGRLLDQLTENDYLVVASDHGFNEYTYAIDINSFLAEIGLLTWSDDDTIDHSATVAFYNMWTVYFNPALLSTDELARRGVTVPPGIHPRDALIDYIQQKGRAIVHPDSGEPMPIEFVRVAEGSIGRAPDLIVTGTYADYMVEFWDRKNPHTAVIRELAEDERWDHQRNGLFMAWGGGLQRGYDAGTRSIEDIAPTLLYMMGLPVPASLEGRVMEDLFTPAVLANNPIAIVREYATIAKSARIPSEQRGDLEKKLKSLGYVR